MELEQLCKLGLPSITMARDYSGNDLHILASYGYVQQEEEEDDDDDDSGISFIKRETSSDGFSICYIFPKEIPKPQYDQPEQRGPSTPPLSEWRKYVAFQHYTSNLPESQQLRIYSQIPRLNLSVDQKVMIMMMIQPFVMLDAHLNTRLRIEKLVIGVPKNQFFGLKQEQYLGFYPDFVQIKIEPVFDGRAIPILEQRPSDLQSLPSSTVKKTSTTMARGQLGYGPANINVERSWATEREVRPSPLKVELIHIDEADGANAAIFEWSIKRWNNKEKYRMKKPHSGLRLFNPQLPFPCSASINPELFPDILWKFPEDLTNLKFRISLQIQMRLVWFVGTLGIRSLGSTGEPVKYENVWDLGIRSLGS